MLDGDEVVLDERNVIVVLPLEHSNDSSVIDPGSEDDEKIGEESGLLREVEGEGLANERKEEKSAQLETRRDEETRSEPCSRSRCWQLERWCP